MHYLLYHRHHRYTEEKHGHHEQQHQTCYNCGRQFMKYHGVLHRRRNQCPACHSEFEHSIAAKDAVETKQSSAGGTNIMSRYFKSFTFHPSLKKTKLLLHESTAAIFTTRVSSFNDSTTEVREVEEGNDNHNMAYDGIEEAPCTDRESPCPYALTYETEEVESYQLSHETTINEDVESYQLEWLLYNNVH